MAYKRFDRGPPLIGFGRFELFNIVSIEPGFQAFGHMVHFVSESFVGDGIAGHKGTLVALDRCFEGSSNSWFVAIRVDFTEFDRHISIYEI